MKSHNFAVITKKMGCRVAESCEFSVQISVNVPETAPSLVLGEGRADIVTYLAVIA